MGFVKPLEFLQSHISRIARFSLVVLLPSEARQSKITDVATGMSLFQKVTARTDVFDNIQGHIGFVKLKLAKYVEGMLTGIMIEQQLFRLQQLKFHKRL